MSPPSNHPRVEPCEPPFAPEIHTQLREMMPTADIEPIALFRTMVRNLPMAKASWHLGHYGLNDDLSIPAREREVLIDRICARLRCEYEWGVHVAYFAPLVDLSREHVRSLTHGSSGDACWTETRERLIIEAVDELVDTHDLSEDLWSQLAEHFSTEQLLDLLCITGWYHALAFLARATRLPPERGTPRFADYE